MLPATAAIPARPEVVHDVACAFGGSDTFHSCPGLILDTETTGVSADSDRVVELGAVAYAAGQPAFERRMRLNPGCPIPASASAVHGISDSDVRDKPHFADIADRFLPYLDGRMHGGVEPWLVGYNAIAFDIPLLNAELARVGSRVRIPLSRVIDPMVFVRWHLRHLRSRSLESVCRHFNIPGGRAHSALDDARATGALLYRLIHDGLLPDRIGEAYEQQVLLMQRLQRESEAYAYWLYHDRSDGSLRLGAGSLIGTPLAQASADYLRSLLAKIPDLPDQVRREFLAQASQSPRRDIALR
jgi:DNA polymerase-3 subunit epsilon